VAIGVVTTAGITTVVTTKVCATSGVKIDALMQIRQPKLADFYFKI
jgi:hypothetical protein